MNYKQSVMIFNKDYYSLYNFAFLEISLDVCAFSANLIAGYLRWRGSGGGG